MMWFLNDAYRITKRDWKIVLVTTFVSILLVLVLPIPYPWRWLVVFAIGLPFNLAVRYAVESKGDA